jgi:RNA polymerase sigma-70 factor (ECF subfamily)
VARLGDTPELAPEIHGSQAVAGRFRGRARMAQVMLLDGEPGLVIAPGGTPRMLFDFVIVDDRITEIAMMGNPPIIAAMTLEP